MNTFEMDVYKVLADGSHQYIITIAYGLTNTENMPGGYIRKTYKINQYTWTPTGDVTRMYGEVYLINDNDYYWQGDIEFTANQ